jgi:DNA-binding IscR family transcriptional regulator
MSSLFTAKTRIALDVLMTLKDIGHGNSELLAQRIGRSKTFTEQVNTKLAKAGILVSRKGPGGGYLRRATPVTLFEVMVATGQVSEHGILVLDPSSMFEEKLIDYIAKVEV